jgi:hypothetical protein
LVLGVIVARKSSKPISIKAERKKREQLGEQDIKVVFHYFTRDDPQARRWNKWWQGMIRNALADLTEDTQGVA